MAEEREERAGGRAGGYRPGDRDARGGGGGGRGGERGGRGGGRGGERGGRGGGRRFGGGRRRRGCPFCQQGAPEIDYKKPDELRYYLTERGKIKPRRKNATCAKHQRSLAVAIKRARHLALLPFSTESARG